MLEPEVEEDGELLLVEEHGDPEGELVAEEETVEIAKGEEKEISAKTPEPNVEGEGTTLINRGRRSRELSGPDCGSMRSLVPRFAHE